MCAISATASHASAPPPPPAPAGRTETTTWAAAIAASANFPVLLLSVTWRGLTTRGAVAGSLAGLLCALLLGGLVFWIYKNLIEGRGEEPPAEGEATAPADHPVAAPVVRGPVETDVDRLLRRAEAAASRQRPPCAGDRRIFTLPGPPGPICHRADFGKKLDARADFAMPRRS